MSEADYAVIEDVAKEINVILRKAEDVLLDAQDKIESLLAKVAEEREFLTERRNEARWELEAQKRKATVKT
jgi:hypothetical protein